MSIPTPFNPLGALGAWREVDLANFAETTWALNEFNPLGRRQPFSSRDCTRSRKDGIVVLTFQAFGTSPFRTSGTGSYNYGLQSPPRRENDTPAIEFWFLGTPVRVRLTFELEGFSNLKAFASADSWETWSTHSVKTLGDNKYIVETDAAVSSLAICGIGGWVVGRLVKIETL